MSLILPAGRLLAAALVLPALLIGCGDDDDNAAPSETTEAGSDTTAPPATDPAEAVEIPEVAFDAADYSFDMPAELDSGVTSLTMTNSGAEDHHAQLMKLNDGVTYDQLVETFVAEGEGALRLVSLAGGAGATVPGGTTTNVVNLAAGEHALICVIPSPDGIPHAAKGMLQPVTVVDNPDAVNELPDTAEGEIVLADFSIAVPDDFDGSGTFLVTNEGPQPHEAIVSKLNDGATADDYVAWFAGPAGPPPAANITGFQGVAAGQSGLLELDLDAGEYVFICFIPDPASGTAHYDLGMVTEFSIS